MPRTSSCQQRPESKSTHTYCAQPKYRQLARILKHLRDELHQRNQRLAKPTSGMIDHLVFNCPPDLLQGDDWESIIYRVLCFLEEQMSPANEHKALFLRGDEQRSLFPNEELFDQHDVFLFAKSLLHLQRQNLDDGVLSAY